MKRLVSALEIRLFWSSFRKAKLALKLNSTVFYCRIGSNFGPKTDLLNFQCRHTDYIPLRIVLLSISCSNSYRDGN